MRVCGIELSGNDAIVCLLSLEGDVFQIPDCRARKLSLPKEAMAKDLKYFQKSFAQLVQDYKVDKVVIRQRPMKGKFAGGAIGFKLEAAMELLDGVEVIVMAPTDIKASLKRNPVHVAFGDTGLKGFQEPAFNTAFAYLMKDHYSDDENKTPAPRAEKEQAQKEDNTTAPTNDKAATSSKKKAPAKRPAKASPWG